MKRKRVVLSTMAGMLCLVGMFAGFITNGLNHTHAEVGLQANTTQPNSTKSAQSAVRSEDVIQGNIYYGSRGTSVYALNVFTGELIWKYSPASSLVTVTNGIAYVTSSSDTLVALQAFTGSLIWSYQIRSDFLWSPLIVNNSVYLSANDGLYALEASHGSLLWHYQTTSQVFGPLFAHSTIYLVTLGGTYPACYNLVSALKATDGSLLWSYKVDCTEAGIGGATVSFVKGTVLVRGLGDEGYQQISFLDPMKGSVIYSHNMYVEFHDFFLLDGIIYFTDYTHVYAVRLSDGAVLWSYQPVGGSDRIEVVDHVVYVFEGGFYETGPVTAHKAIDGSLLWSMQPAIDALVAGSNNIVYFFQGGPTTTTTTARKATDGALLWSNQGTCGWFGGIVNGTIYLNGCPIYALHASNGTLLWSSGITGWIERIINGFLYVTEQSTGILYVLDASNGTQVWSSGKAASISTVVNHIVFVKSSRGTVYALDDTNGTQLWSY
jgi:outer membrane protein assembly factor BamB